MIDQWSEDRTGWALFSDDMTMRYRLARSLIGSRLDDVPERDEPKAERCVFVMLNPSTADAFQLDPTVNECRKRALSLGADVLEVVNLFALRSPHPVDLRKRAFGFRGDDQVNNDAIIKACTGAAWVIAAWGNHGALDHRDLTVFNMLRALGIKLHHLGLTADGYPKHPLARGKHRIPADLQLTAWSTEVR